MELPAFTSLTAAEPVETIVRRLEFWLRYHRGVATGQGDHTFGDLPRLFAARGDRNRRLSIRPGGLNLPLR